MDAVEVKCRKYLKKMLSESGNDHGIVVYFDSEGDIQMNVITPDELDRVMESIIDGEMKGTDINDA